MKLNENAALVFATVLGALMLLVAIMVGSGSCATTSTGDVIRGAMVLDTGSIVVESYLDCLDEQDIEAEDEIRAGLREVLYALADLEPGATPQEVDVVMTAALAIAARHDACVGDDPAALQASADFVEAIERFAAGLE